MSKAILAIPVLLLTSAAAWAFDVPPVGSVVANQNKTAGTFTASSTLLSGTITPYTAGGRSLNYLTVSVDGKLQGGFFTAPADLAGQLRGYMNPGRNYTVNLVYTMERVNINGFAPAYGVVSRVDFVGPGGQVLASFATKR